MQIKIFLIPVTRAVIDSSTPASPSAGKVVVENGWIDVTGVMRYTQAQVPHNKYFKFLLAKTTTILQLLS